MMNWRNAVGPLLLVAIAACATATNSGDPTGASGAVENGGQGPSAGSGGSPRAGAPSAGAPSAGAPSAGAPGAGAPNGGSANGGSAQGGSANGGSAQGGVGGSSSTAGASGHAGASSAGQAGTSAAGAGGSAGAAGAAGAAGGTSTGPCTDPKDVTGGNSGNFGTLGAKCFRTMDKFNTIGCSNWGGRTIKVNGVLVPCPGTKTTFAPTIGGYTYFDASAGTSVDASFYWYSS